MAKETTADSVRVAARKLGHLGGIKGGPARKAALTQAQRTAIARKAGKARAARHAKGSS